MAKYYVGVDLGGTKVLAGLLTAKFKFLQRFKNLSESHLGGDHTYNQIVTAVQEVIKLGGIKPREIAGIAIGAPGPLDPVKGIILQAPNLNFKNFPLKKKLQKDFGCPVVVDNDVNLGTYGEYHFGAGKEARHLVGVFPGTGIGGGLVLDGQIFRGASGAAGEIGHVTLDPDGPLCGCGKHGCLESFAGRNVVASQLSVLALRGQAPHLMEHYGTDIMNMRSKSMIEAIEAGDSCVEIVVRAAARWIGIACANVANVISPDMIVLGGGQVEKMPNIFLDEVEKAMKRDALPSIRKFCRIATAELEDDAVMLGAAKLLSENLKSKK